MEKNTLNEEKVLDTTKTSFSENIDKKDQQVIHNTETEDTNKNKIKSPNKEKDKHKEEPVEENNKDNSENEKTLTRFIEIGKNYINLKNNKQFMEYIKNNEKHKDLYEALEKFSESDVAKLSLMLNNIKVLSSNEQDSQLNTIKNKMNNIGKNLNITLEVDVKTNQIIGEKGEKPRNQNDINESELEKSEDDQNIIKNSTNGIKEIKNNIPNGDNNKNDNVDKKEVDTIKNGFKGLNKNEIDKSIENNKNTMIKAKEQKSINLTK